MLLVSRRSFVGAGVCSLFSPAIAKSAVLSTAKVGHDRVWLRRLGVNEEIAIKLHHETIEEAREALRALSWFFRDWKDDDAAFWIDPNLPHVLAEVQAVASAEWGGPKVIQVTSGYRTPRRNSTLKGAVHNSLHTKGRASDILISGFSPDLIGKIAAGTSCGGIGVYRSSGFTHLDTGRRRYW